MVDTGTSSTGTPAKTALSDQILAALKEKPAPELCLDSQDLEVGENDRNIFWQISGEVIGEAVLASGGSNVNISQSQSGEIKSVSLLPPAWSPSVKAS